MKYVSIGLRVLLTVAFVAAGGAKVAGVDGMVQSFDAIGWGQWFRYLTGAIELAAALLLWVPRTQLLGAGLLIATMVGAVIAHVLVLGPSMVPAIVLGLLAAAIAYLHREQAARLLGAR